MFYVSKTSTTRMSDQIIMYLSKIIKMEDDLFGGLYIFFKRTNKLLSFGCFIFVQLMRAVFLGFKRKTNIVNIYQMTPV